MKTAGIVLTLAGAAAAAVGGGLLAATASGSDGRGDDLGYGQAGKEIGTVFGGALLGLGGACVLVGIPLWAVGAARSPSAEP